ncbi:hypothetical protein MCP1_340009 [Candidatus Terasakiella magnetica]|nr:hypothetical protein MCP1_340009 [Candidatus Terasakiella magnetica]
MLRNIFPQESQKNRWTREGSDSRHLISLGVLPRAAASFLGFGSRMLHIDCVMTSFKSKRLSPEIPFWRDHAITIFDASHANSSSSMGHCILDVEYVRHHVMGSAAPDNLRQT